MKLKLISCEIFYREMCYAISKSKHVIDVEFLEKGLHDIGSEKMYSKIQETINQSDKKNQYDYILLGYGLCNNGTLSLKTKEIPLVIPRAHDCITLLMGSKEKYREYFDTHTGSFYLSTGWIERSDLDEHATQNQLGMEFSMEQLIEEYGEDNAEFLYETMNQKKHYNELTFIETGVEPNSSFEDNAKEQANELGLEYKHYKGDLSLIEKFLNGDWNKSEFKIVEPNNDLSPSYDDNIFK